MLNRNEIRARKGAKTKRLVEFQRLMKINELQQKINKERIK